MDFISGYWDNPSFSPLQLIIKSTPVQKASYKRSKYCSKKMSKDHNHKDNIHMPQISDETLSIFR
jgi:hypothetical protein